MTLKRTLTDPKREWAGRKKKKKVNETNLDSKKLFNLFDFNLSFLLPSVKVSVRVILQDTKCAAM
jgi:hypothetical protein